MTSEQADHSDVAMTESGPDANTSSPPVVQTDVVATSEAEPTPANAREGAASGQAPAEGSPTEATPPRAAHTAALETEAAAVTADSETPAEAREEAGGEEAGGEEAGGEEVEASEGGGPTVEGQQKKKRRRKKRKKKPEGSAETESREGSRPHRATERTPFHTGEEVFGKVTAVLDTAIMIDLSGKALAIFDRSEMEPDDLVPTVSDRFVARIHNDGARGGLVVLTRKPLREDETRPKLELSAKSGELVNGLVTGVIKGGVEVDIAGVRAFAPASGMDLHPAQANFTALVGQRLEFKIASFDKVRRDVVVTRRPMLEAEAHERRKQALGLLQEGQVLQGVVRTVVEWGAFVALPSAENLEGLVHVSEASHDPRTPITEVMGQGDRFDVKILKIDERGKIWLSRKALVEDPWAQARQKYEARSRHHGKVIRLERFGAFVELEPGVEGMLHAADLSLERVEHTNSLLTEGQELDVIVQHFDPRTRKITLHPAPSPERADETPQKILRNALVKAEVVRGEAAGVVVRVLGVTGRGARGFIPAGQTGTNRGTDLRKAFKPGSVLDLKVVDLDARTGEPKLSIRGFKEDEERRAHKEYSQKLKKEGGFGTLGDLLKDKLRAAQEREV